MKRIEILFLIVILFAGSAQAGAITSVFTINNIDYIVHSDFDTRKNSSPELFTEIFERESFEQFIRFNVKRPNCFTVHISMGAWIFKDITGYGLKTAALYSCERDSFFFQRPEALRRKGILKATIIHEMTHCVVANVRLNAGLVTCRPEYAWLEESFCLALSPVSNSSRKYETASLVKLSFSEFRLNLLKAIRSNTGERSKAYYWMELWGRFLLEKLGQNGFLNLAAGTGNPGAKVTKDLYKEFLRTLKKRVL